MAAAADSIAARMEDAHVRLEVHIDAGVGRIVADEKRLGQIVYNLLSNAVAFSPEGSLVRLSARAEGDFVEIAVTDQGAGIPGTFVDSVFDRFAAMPRGASRGGVGLGLSIVKSLVDLHGGTVVITSEEGRGTIARVRLPVRPALDAVAAE
jgi:signal transduction histidine kinase